MSHDLEPQATARFPIGEPEAVTGHNVAVGVAVSAFLHLTTALLLAPRFATNDDPTMLSIASGAAYGEPSESLVFMNVLLGYSLKWLYTLTTALPWYGLMLYVFQAAGMGVLLACARPHRRDLVTWALLSGTIVLVGMDLASSLHFTAAGVLVGVAGVLLALQIDQGRPHRRGLILVAGGLVGSSFLLRPDALAAALLTATPALAFHLVRTRRIARPVLGVATLALAVILTGFVADTVRYRNGEWSEFREFDAARGQLHGTPRLHVDDRIGPVLQEINWSWSDRAMFENFFFTNDDVFGTESLEVLLDRRRSVVEPIGYVDAAERTLRGFQPAWLAFAAIALLITIRRPHVAALAFGWMTWVLVIMTLLSVRLRLPNHVALPMLLSGCLGLLSLLRSLPPSSPGTIRHKVEIAVAIAFVVASLGPVSNVLDAEARRQLNDADAANLAEAQRLAGDNGAVISLGAQVGLSSVSPLNAVPGGDDERPIVILGWNSRTPDFDRYLGEIGVDDLDAALMDRNDLVLVATEREAAVYSSFLFEHFNVHGAFWPVGSVEEWSIGLYRGFAVATLGSERIEVRRGDQAETYLIGEPAPGFLQAVQHGSQTPGVVRGWLGDERAAPADRILVFVDRQLTAVSIEQLTLDGAPPMLSFYIDMPPALLPDGAEVRVFGVWDGMARELSSEVSIGSGDA